jgi:hypothetical protein
MKEELWTAEDTNNALKALRESTNFRLVADIVKVTRTFLGRGIISHINVRSSNAAKTVFTAGEESNKTVGTVLSCSLTGLRVNGTTECLYIVQQRMECNHNRTNIYILEEGQPPRNGVGITSHSLTSWFSIVWSDSPQLTLRHFCQETVSSAGHRCLEGITTYDKS